MGMTMTQKILAAHAGVNTLEAGQLIEVNLDLVLGNDITSPVAIHEMDKMKVRPGTSTRRTSARWRTASAAGRSPSPSPDG